MSKLDCDLDRFIDISEITPEGMKILVEKYDEDPYELVANGLTVQDAMLCERNHIETHVEYMPSYCDEEVRFGYALRHYGSCLRWFAEDEETRKKNPVHEKDKQFEWKRLEPIRDKLEEFHNLLNENYDEFVWRLCTNRLKFFYGIENREQYYQYLKDHPGAKFDFWRCKSIFRIKSDAELAREAREAQKE